MYKSSLGVRAVKVLEVTSFCIFGAACAEIVEVVAVIDEDPKLSMVGDVTGVGVGEADGHAEVEKV